MRRFNLLGRIHLSKDRSEIVARDETVAALGEVLDEFHDLHAETVGLDPKFELGVLRLDLLDHAVEHEVDLISEVLELLRTQVRVIVYHTLDF